MNNTLPYKRLCYLKIIAAIIVVISHLIKEYNLGIFNQLFDFGTYSVALFFFLSGYGLMYSLQNKKKLPRQLLKKKDSQSSYPIHHFYYRLDYNFINNISTKRIIYLGNY